MSAAVDVSHGSVRHVTTWWPRHVVQVLRVTSRRAGVTGGLFVGHSWGNVTHQGTTGDYHDEPEIPP